MNETHRRGAEDIENRLEVMEIGMWYRADRKREPITPGTQLVMVDECGCKSLAKACEPSAGGRVEIHFPSTTS